MNEKEGKEPNPEETEKDYKALYEKLQKDNLNLEKYNQDLKSKISAKLTEEEKLAAERKEREEYYKNIELENKTIKLKSLLQSSVNDEKVQKEVVDFLVGGDEFGALKAMNKYINDQKKQYESQIQELKITKGPTPPGSSGGDGTKKWTDYTMAELNAMKEKNPTQYNEILKSIK